MSVKRLEEALGGAPPRGLRGLDPELLARLADDIDRATAWEREEIERGLRRAVRMVPLPFRAVVRGILRA